MSVEEPNPSYFPFEKVAVFVVGAKPKRVLSDIKSLSPHRLVFIEQQQEGWNRSNKEYRDEVLDPFFNDEEISRYVREARLETRVIQSLTDRHCLFSLLFSVAEAYRDNQVCIIASAMPNEAFEVSLTISGLFTHVQCYRSGKKHYDSYSKALYGDPKEEGGETRFIDVLNRDTTEIRDVWSQTGRVFRALHDEYLNRRYHNRGIPHPYPERVVATTKQLAEKLKISPRGIGQCLDKLSKNGILAKSFGRLSLPPYSTDLATMLRKSDPIKTENKSELASFLKSKEDEIDGIYDRFAGHPAVTPEGVRNFLLQFPTRQTAFAALRMLQRMTFINSEVARGYGRDYLAGLTDEQLKVSHFTTVGKKADSPDIISYLMTHQDKRNNVRFEEWKNILGIKEPCVVRIVDDTLISGTQAIEIFSEFVGVSAPGKHVSRLSDVELRRLGKNDLHAFVLVKTPEGESKVKAFLKQHGLEIEIDSHEVFSREQNSCFDGRLGQELFPEYEQREEIKFAIRNICRELLWGIADRDNWSAGQLEMNCLGYGNWQLLLVFSHNIPSSTLPIFWCEGDVNLGGITTRWTPLFPRR